MSDFLLPCYQSLRPYVPGEQPRDRRYVKLNTNESPFPPSPRVLEAISRERVAGLNLYPDPLATALRERIAAEYGLTAENVFVGNGSDEVLGLAFLAYVDAGRPPMIPEISYGFYPIYARLCRAVPERVPLRADFTLPGEAFRHARGMVALANPNAPTALALPLADIEGIVAGNPGQAVLIDEAYADFGGESALPLLSRYENLLIVRTFSKSRSLAGGRLGYALANPAIIRDLERMKGSFHPYSINSLTMAAGMAAMEDRAYFDRCVAEIRAQRTQTADALRAMGFALTDSQTNFLFASPPGLAGKTYYERLRERGVLVRYLEGKALKPYVRVTVGAEAQMARFLEATEDILREAGKGGGP